ncbi:MAG TPA: glycosyltransferase family A protein [Solirubrobacteraceae bacterium]|nr:glycosyltransferase family A protein [Solirubrobacteraceae bacterium]
MPATSQPAVSVIVPARDAAATLPATLDALGAQEDPPTYEVIVVDNGSRDDTAALAQQAGVTVLRLSRGPGPGVARHAGAGAARAPVLAFTDADCAPAPGWLRAGLCALEHADLVQGRVAPAGPVPALHRTLEVTCESGLYEAANLFVRRVAYDAAGGFGAGLEGPGAPPFGEDVLFGWAIRRAGLRTAFADEALVRHAVLPRSAAAYVRERGRLALFAELIAAVPELRAQLWAGIFLTRRHAKLWLALAGGIAALVMRRPGTALLAGPYARELLARARGEEGPTARLAAVHALADLHGLTALALASARTRTPAL